MMLLPAHAAQLAQAPGEWVPSEGNLQQNGSTVRRQQAQSDVLALIGRWALSAESPTQAQAIFSGRGESATGKFDGLAAVCAEFSQQVEVSESNELDGIGAKAVYLAARPGHKAEILLNSRWLQGSPKKEEL
jgi:hypothetical protein